MKKLFLPLVCLLTFSLSQNADAKDRWWKGNLHTHTFWSDGDDFPEMVADWYQKNGYHFLAYSDHNSIQDGEKWAPIHNADREAALQKYEAFFGKSYIRQKTTDGTNYVQLRTFKEFAPRFQKPNKFLLMLGEEVSAHRLSTPIHMGAINVKELITPRTGTSIVETIQNNVDAVLAQRARTGQPMFPHVNHPNFGWAITAEELMQIRGEKFFEVWNGHTHVHNEGDILRASTERMWDIMLTRRLAELGLEVIYGIGTDDSHNYHSFTPKKSHPGRGWIVVRAAALTPAKLIEAMEAGDFYASSGVALQDVKVDSRRYTVKVAPEEGVTYRIQFIGTRKGYDATSTPVKNEKGDELRVTRGYSKEVGMVLEEKQGTSATYHFRGDEIYVRAKVISSRINEASEVAREEPLSKTRLAASDFGYQAAWAQPVVLNAKSGRAVSASGN